MKRLTFLAVLATHFSLAALPIGNPWEPSLFCDGQGVLSDCLPLPDFVDCLGDIRLGFYGDYVQDRHLRAENGAGDIHLVTLNTNAAIVHMTFCDRLDLFATFGATSFFLQTVSSAFNLQANTQQMLDVNIDTNFSWSAGARGTIWTCCNWAFGGEAQYFQSRPSMNSFEIFQDSNFTRYFANERFKYQEWQFGLALTYQICLAQSIQVLPYVGISWSHARVNMNSFELNTNSDPEEQSIPLTFNSLENQRLWGYAIGFTFVGCERFQLTIENRFASEKAISLNAGVLF